MKRKSRYSAPPPEEVSEGWWETTIDTPTTPVRWIFKAESEEEARSYVNRLTRVRAGDEEASGWQKEKMATWHARLRRERAKKRELIRGMHDQGNTATQIAASTRIPADIVQLVLKRARGKQPRELTEALDAWTPSTEF